MSFYLKDPLSRVDYTIDWSPHLDGQTIAAASMHSAFNCANAIGAWLGGLVIAWGYGYAATGFVGAGLSFLGLLVFGVSAWLEWKQPSARLTQSLPSPAD